MVGALHPLLPAGPAQEPPRPGPRRTMEPGAVRRRRRGKVAPVFSLVVRFDVRDPAAAARFDELTAEVVEAIAAQEPGTLVYATHRVAGDPMGRVFYEVYADEAAFGIHEEAAHVLRFHALKAPLLRSEPRVELLGPGPASLGRAHPGMPGPAAW